MTKINPNGTKFPKVPRGTKRALRRVGLVRGWKSLIAQGISTASMLPA